MPVVKQPSSVITGIFARDYPISGANIQACKYSYSSPYQDSSYDINTKMSSFDVEIFTLVTRLYEKSTCFYYVFWNWPPNQISLLISKKRKVVLLTRRCDHIIVFYWRTSVLIGYRKTTFSRVTYPSFFLQHQKVLNNFSPISNRNFVTLSLLGRNVLYHLIFW